MKKNYLIIAFLFSSIAFGQTTFVNTTADGLWSTVGNWDLGLPNSSSTNEVTLNANVNLDSNQTIGGFLKSGTRTVSGTGTLTSTGSFTGALLCVDTNFTFNSNLVLNGTDINTIKSLQVNNAVGSTISRQLTLGPLSVLTFTTPASVVTGPSSKVVFQGKIQGAAALFFNGVAEFDVLSDNRGFNGEMVFNTNGSSVIANTTGTAAFLKVNQKIQVNGTGCSLTLNGANSCNGYLSVGSANAFALNINANQQSFGNILLGNGPLAINVSPAVTNLSFANNAAIAWGSGTIAITGFQSGEIRFGTTSSALTASQLSKITADGAAAGLPLALDSNGFLVFIDPFAYFTNAAGAGNGKWSTTTNWSTGALPTQSAQLNANVDLDTNQTLLGTLRSETSTLSGAGKLTSTGTVSDNIALLSIGANFSYNGKIEINNPNTQKALRVNNTLGAAYRQLTLGPLSVLTLTTPAIITTQFDSKVVFQGKIDGAANLNFTGASEFAASSDNTLFNGDMVFSASASTVIARTTGTGAFLKSGRNIQVNATSCSLTLNGANSCNGSVVLATASDFTLNINANQGSFGTITVGNSPLRINVATAVNNLSFANSAAIAWGAGTVAIIGYQSGEIRFGTTSSALTATQLSRITADGAASGLPLALDSNGYLVFIDPFAYFTNAAGAGNGKWSTATNWTAGALPTQSAQLTANVDLDTNQTLPGILRSATNTVSGIGTLTSAGTVSDGVALLSTGTGFTFNGNLVINNTFTQKSLQVNNTVGTGVNRQLTLGSSSVLTLTTAASVVTEVNSKVVFQGTILGAAALNFAGAAEFGTASDNRNFTGEMVFTGASSTVIANTTGTGYFLSSGRQVRVNATNCSLTLNGADSCNGNINVASTHAFTLNINANQGSLGTVTVTNGPITINVAAAVTTLSFANSAAISWGTGTVTITGYQSGEIRFGTTSNALTTAQLSRITADGAAAGLPLALDSNGYLVVGDLFAYFNNTSGNGLWSNAANWAALLLPRQSAHLNANVNLDSNFSITGMLRSNTSTLSGAGTLTSAGSGSDSVALLCTGANFTFNGNLIINNSNLQKTLQVNNDTGLGNRQLTLGPLSVLTLTTPALVVTGINSKVVFQGKIQGVADLNFLGVAEFGPESDNRNLNGDLVFNSSAATITANTIGIGYFLKSGRKVQVNAAGCSLTLNGANSCNSNLVLIPSSDFTLNINANQGSFGNIAVGNAPLRINVAPAVTNLSFANNAAIAWGTTGTVVITGYQSGEIRFGTTSSALTATQLSRITADGAATGRALSLDSNGYLVVVYTTWTGTANTIWTDPSNWTAGVPFTSSNATIGSATNQPTISSNVAINSLAIDSGATLTVNEGRVLDVARIITNSGDLILKSSATGTASLVNTSAAPNVTQQRYFSSNQRGWRMLSNPLASTTFNTLAAASGITIGNNFTGEYVSSSNTFTSTSGTATMDTQKAYKLFITGRSGEGPGYTTGPSNVTLVNKGTATNTAPAAITTILGAYYLVGNPYTAPVSVASIISASTGLSSTVAYYNPANGSTNVKIKAGGYDATTATGTAGSATDVVIPVMGAIFVQATSVGTINIPRTTIFTGTPIQSGTYNHKTAQIKVASNAALKIEVRSGSVYYDALSLQFKAVAEPGRNIDFGKLPNSILDAYTIAGNKRMAVAEVELAAQTIPLGITSTIQKSFTFKVVENTVPAGFEAVLVDKLLNTNTVLTLGTTYDFNIDNIPNSQGDARFVINLKATGTLSVVETALDSKIQIWPNPVHGQFTILNVQNQNDGISIIEISNLNGQIIHSQKSNPGITTAIQTKSWAKGVYIVKVKNNGNQTTKRLLIQ